MAWNGKIYIIATNFLYLLEKLLLYVNREAVAVEVAVEELALADALAKDAIV